MFEFLIGVISLIAGWLSRGGLAAYRQRDDLSATEMVIAFLGGGPGGRDR